MKYYTHFGSSFLSYLKMGNICELCRNANSKSTDYLAELLHQAHNKNLNCSSSDLNQFQIRKKKTKRCIAHVSLENWTRQCDTDFVAVGWDNMLSQCLANILDYTSLQRTNIRSSLACHRVKV